MRALGLLVIRRADVEAIYGKLAEVSKQAHLIRKEIQHMGAREDAAYAKLNETIVSVKDGFAVRDEKIAALEAALRDADANAAAALEADSEADAARVEAADAALAELVDVAEPTEPGQPTDSVRVENL